MFSLPSRHPEPCNCEGNAKHRICPHHAQVLRSRAYTVDIHDDLSMLDSYMDTLKN